MRSPWDSAAQAQTGQSPRKRGTGIGCGPDAQSGNPGSGVRQRKIARAESREARVESPKVRELLRAGREHVACTGPPRIRSLAEVYSRRNQQGGVGPCIEEFATATAALHLSLGPLLPVQVQSLGRHGLKSGSCRRQTQTAANLGLAFNRRVGQGDAADPIHPHNGSDRPKTAVSP